MNIISLKCPNCGANLDGIRLEEGMEVCFCSYCGAKIAVQDEHHHTIRQVDVARIKEAETSHAVRLKELEMEERRREEERIEKSAKVRARLGILGVGVLLMLVGWFAGSASGDNNSPFYMMSLVGFLILLGVFSVSLPRDM